MRALRLQHDEAKLAVYRRFTVAFCVTVVASIAFICWEISEHVLTDCLEGWAQLWLSTAFWHILPCAMLLVIMLLWRPSNNRQAYSFTPLVNDEGKLFFIHNVFGTEVAKVHQKLSSGKDGNQKSTN